MDQSRMNEQLSGLQQQISTLSLLTYFLQKQVDALRTVLDRMNPAAVTLALNEMMDTLKSDPMYIELREAGRRAVIEKPAQE